jgi:hypothetical protein
MLKGRGWSETSLQILWVVSAGVLRKQIVNHDLRKAWEADVKQRKPALPLSKARWLLMDLPIHCSSDLDSMKFRHVSGRLTALQPLATWFAMHICICIGLIPGYLRCLQLLAIWHFDPQWAASCLPQCR